MTQRTGHRVELGSPLGDGVLLFRRMTGAEQLGRLFEFELDLLSRDYTIKLEDVLGQCLTVKLELPGGGKRYFNGHVTRFSFAGSWGQYAHYKASLRPWLWFLTRTSDCRIFQGQTVPEIVKSLFREHGFSDFEEALDGSYEQRDYCVQYRETDFNFVSRLLEQEGIYYFFKHEDGKHTIVLADHYESHARIPGYEELSFDPAEWDDDVIEKDHVIDWSVAQQVQPGTYALNDYDYEQPRVDLEARCHIERGHPQAHHEIYDYPGEYRDFHVGEACARTHIEALQAQHETVEATANARGLHAGGLFELLDHPREDQNREYLIVSASYSIEYGEYETVSGFGIGAPFLCTVTAIESRQPYRPPRVTPRPIVEGPQTAMVVGKQGEEIWTDELGRIKVQFHWDREGQMDENSSCWIRVAQPWAGNRWGGQFIPRIGNEVIIEFLEGDPDRPIVAGSVYNGSNHPPSLMPKLNYVSGVRTLSIPGGGASSEIACNDEKDKETVYIGTGDLGFYTRRTWRTIVDEEQHLEVKKSGHRRWKNDLEDTIEWSRTVSVGGTDNLSVGGDRIVSIDGQQDLKVGGPAQQQYSAGLTQNVMGQHQIDAGTLQVNCQGGITLTCGASEISLTPGAISIKSPVIQLQGATVDLGAPLVTFQAVLQGQVVTATSVASASYTPGAGNML